MTKRTASCSCGQLTLTTHDDPIRVSICHCLACQRRTGSVFGAQARFNKSGVTIVGEVTQYTRIGDEGCHVVFNFCPRCGATVYYSVTGYDEDNIAVPVGAFADPTFPAPTYSVYEERQHAWVGLPQNIEHMN